MKRAALTYARNGWPVFPLIARTKHPYVKGGFLRATTDARIIEQWWTKWPDASIGIATGIAFDAIDLDSQEARDHYEEQTPITGPVNKTAKGWHVLVRRTGLRNLRGVYRGSDFRGLGGLIIVPPSIHESGVPYIWEASPILPLPTMPDWYRTLLTQDAAAKATEQLLRSGTLSKATGIAHRMAAEGHPWKPTASYKWWRCGMHRDTRNSMLFFPGDGTYRCLTCDQYGDENEVFQRY
ncbi:MAG: bifunctional DNA primase/polymerase, partial [Acidimicrobiia bacterium]